LRRWNETDGHSAEPNLILFEKIVLNLSRLEEGMGDYDQAILHLEMCRKVSPKPGGYSKPD